LNWVELTQGPLALTNIPPYTLGFPGLGQLRCGTRRLLLPRRQSGSVAYVVISRLVGSRIGRAMVALKENETLASSVGIDVTHYPRAGGRRLGGGGGQAPEASTRTTQESSTRHFPVHLHRHMVIMVITGGKGTLAGPIVGGLIFGFLPVVLRPFAAPAVQWILYGALMIAIVFVSAAGHRAGAAALDGELDQVQAATGSCGRHVRSLARER
jgi:branched-chain amino acid transport system permease protein